MTVIDGEIIDDADTWLPANAGDDFLHHIERWDLIESRHLEQEEPPSNEHAMKPTPRTLRLNID